jgi:Ribbon-helix-helix domain
MFGMSPRKKKVKAVLYLYAEQVKTLKKISEDDDVPMSALIRTAVSEFLAKYPSKK